jgi:hypothetical protein
MARMTKAQLIRLQKKYKTDVAIGKEFGITRQAIHQLRKKYGIESNLINNPGRNFDMYNMYKDGISVRKLQKHYNLSSSQTYRIINNQKRAEEEARKAKEAKRTGNQKKTRKKTNKKVVKKTVQKKAPIKMGKKATKRKPRAVKAG